MKPILKTDIEVTDDRRASTTRARRAEPATRRGRQTRQILLDAAEGVFAEKGFFQASIVDITRRAQVSQGGFYIYFNSKEDAFFEVLKFHSRLIRECARKAREKASNGLDAERLGLEAFFKLIIERPQIYRVVRQAEFVDPKMFREHYRPVVRSYTRSLRDGMAKGELRQLDPETLAYCMFGIADFLGMRWPYWTGKPIPKQVFASAMDFILRGMEAGHAGPSPSRS